MEIVRAEHSHVPEIVELWKELMDFHKNLDSFFSRREDGHMNFEKHVNDLIESDDSLVLVALDEGHVVAFSISQISEYPPVLQLENYGHIWDMAVKSGYRGRGIGGLMLAKILEWFKSRKIRRIELRVAVKNRVGYSFWKKQGFEDYLHVLFLNI